MPRKGMRSVFFQSKKPNSNSNSSYRPDGSPHHSFSESLMEENIETTKSFVSKWANNVNDVSLFNGNRNDAKQYIDVVKKLHTAMHSLVSRNPNSEKLVRAQNVMRIAMEILQKEFYQVLSVNREFLYPESVSSMHSPRSTSASTSDLEIESEDEFRFAYDHQSIAEVEKASIAAMADLKLIADCMISTGYGKECVKVYKIIRKSIVDESLYNLGIEKMSSAKLQKMDWEVLEMKIKNWLKAVKIAVKTLFDGERILCDHVFSSSSSIRESCFAEISKEGAMILFGFPELVARYKKTPEKIFNVLNLYEAISDLWPEIEYIFSSVSTAMIQSQAITSLIKLGENIRTMLIDFESAIQKDSSKTPVPRGGIHPLTRYVMNYISFLSDYSGILNDIVTNWPVATPLPLPESYYGSPNSKQDENPLTLRLAWLILVLLCKLDGKSEHYNDIALSYLFLANNLRYVVNKVRTSNLKFVIGGDWIEKHEEKVKQYTSNYKRIGWSEVFSAFPADVTAEITAEEAIESFRRFNRAFEETYRRQRSWVVPDPKFRDEIKISLAKDIGVLYGELYARYRERLGWVVGSESVIRFSPDDLGNYLSDLFFGTGSGSVGSVSPSVSSTSSPSPSRGRLSR